jgi:hypothetical protein
MGGAGGAAPMRAQEYSGTGGSRGNNFVDPSGTAALDSTAAPSGAGFINITVNPNSVNACASEVQTNDIYTIVKVTQLHRCTWTVPENVSVIDLFAVGGGGGGGGDSGGGGGGGAALSRTAIAVTPSTTLTLKVGFGGFGGTWGGKLDPQNGDSTTVQLSSGTIFSALGGSASTNAPGAAGGNGGTSTNGGFAGGKGGTGAATGNTVGTSGSRGISNYYYGSQATYGGGGGGGSFPNNASQTPAAGSDGGGQGGYAVSSSANLPGENGQANRGGGGGGGTATGTGLKLQGGNGGSGVILIRYASDTKNQFPASLSGSLYARFAPSDLQMLDPAREALIDSAGKNAAGVVTGSPYLYNRGTSDGDNSTRSTKTLLAMKGAAATDKINLLNLPSNYTMFHIARYVTDGAKGRLFSATTGNWISGFYSGMNGCAHHNYWLTSSGCYSDYLYGWELSMDQLQYYRHNGEDVTLRRDANDGTNNYINAQSISNTFGINNYSSGQTTDWEVADVIVFDRKLSAGEIVVMEQYLARIYGLTLNDAAGSNETDTAYSFNSNYYLGQYASGMYLNDTFTVEGWVNPAAECTSSYCSIFSYEEVLVTKIAGGTFQYALKGGTTDYWAWIDTGVKFPTNQWHHFALVKKLKGNVSNAVEFYLDGKLAYVNDGNPYYPNYAATGNTADVVKTYDTWYWLGVRSNESANFRGQMDEFKIWKVARTAADISIDMHSNDATSPNLQLYYDFNQNTLSNTNDLRNLAFGGPSRSDMIEYGTANYVDVKQVTTSAPYTTVKFPRTYITQNGGWKVPSNIAKSTVIVVGGGGGAGAGDSSNSNTGPAGAGGGGGVTYSATTALEPNAVLPVVVGGGGLGGKGGTAANDATSRNGQQSMLGSFLALGGGGGGSNYSAARGAGSGAGDNSIATGGGTSGYNYPGSTCYGYTAYSGGVVASGYNGEIGTWGWGGSGGGARGAAIRGDCSKPSGSPGPGFIDSISGTEYGRGGYSDGNVANTLNLLRTTNTGFGGSAGYNSGSTNSDGYAGSAGLVIVRWITASKPSYTKPTNAYLNVGMTETFTTNVSQDSATVGLTRMFLWESITPTSNGNFTTLKQGTGASYAAFSWVPSDTSTSGSGYLYRLTVTDSDTAGLYISDSSTAYAVINQPLNVSGTSSIAKTINLARNETFTITLGTPTYRASLSPVIPGISVDTSTAGYAVLKISDTATVGTWLETLTVTDSVSAVFNIPLTIKINAPPTMLNTSEIRSNNLILNLDAGNSQSLLLGDTTTATSAIWRDLSGNKKDASTGGATAVTYDGRTCTAPTYYSSFGGYLQFNGSSDCFHTEDIGMSVDKSFTVEAWYRATQTLTQAGASIFTQNSAGNIAIVLGGATSAGTTDIRVGMYNGTWRNSATGSTPVLNAWSHYVGTFDGKNFKLYLNGSLIDTTPYVGGLSATPNTTGYFIGRRWDGSSYLAGSIASLRVYNIPMTETEVATNFNATKYRFKDAPSSLLKPNQKYGVLTLESFTATSGGDTKTVTFSASPRQGVVWDTTSTPGQIKLSVGESLSVGTYYDTVTVTDNFGASTYVPLTFTVTKADTITVTSGPSLTMVYTGSAPTNGPVARITGLAGKDTATVLTRYETSTVGKTCATGGTCRIGDTGPGGGVVFYVSDTPINKADGISDGGIYLEMHTTSINVNNWSSDPTSVPGTSASIGTGAENTRRAFAQLGASSSLMTTIATGTYGGKSDWFVPSLNEALAMVSTLRPLGLGSFGNQNLWSSTEGTNTSEAEQVWSANPPVSGPLLKSGGYTVRPIRAFGGTTITPTEVDTYTAVGTNINFSIGSLSNYEGVTYETSTLKITQANQNKLSINLYGAIAGSPFLIQTSGGSGPGSVTETVTAGGTATNCALSNHVLSNSSPNTVQVTCNIKVTKASSRNYFAQSLDATVYFMLYVNNMPTNQVGSGTTIGLNGATSLTIDDSATVRAPLINSISISGTTVTINGEGFGSSAVSVKFERNVITSATPSGTDAAGIITVTLPAGARSGYVLVTLPSGAKATSPYLTLP